METHETRPIEPVLLDPVAAPAGSPARAAAARASHPHVYHPSTLLRRLLINRALGGPAEAVADQSHRALPDVPTASSVFGAALAVGAASGFLEMAVHAVQLRIFHRVDWTSLMFNRHAGWMLILVSTSISALLSIALLAPVFLWGLWRRRRGGSASARWTWDLTGTLLGTLLLLGPLQAIHGFAPWAPVAVALGAGVQSRRLLVRRTWAWQRSSRYLGAAVITLLPGYVWWQWQHVSRAPLAAWSQPGQNAPNLIWIVLDTLRADHMSLYGYNRATTPSLDAWAKRGITFEQAHSAAPWTLPSHVTMFTGLWPSEHGARVDREYFGDSPTLAEHLRGSGYATGAVVANVRMCNHVYGVARGFDTYVDYPWNQDVSFHTAMSSSKLGATVLSMAKRLGLPAPHHFPLHFRRPARAITKDARAWLDDVHAHNEVAAAPSHHPFFLFVNLIDVHGPYLPLQNAQRRFSTGPIPHKSLAVPECGWRALTERDKAPPEERASRQQEAAAVAQRLIDLYDDCLLGMDAELGAFLSSLEKSGALENTWLVVTADHGEHFGDHNQFGHGSSLYNAMTHVPLVLIPPLGSGEPAADPARALRDRRVATPVSHRDLPRTMAALLGSSKNNPFPGRSLACYWDGTAPARPDPVLSQLEDPRLRGESFRTENIVKIDSLIDEDHVLIETFNQPAQLYELWNDPRQEHNLADRPDQQARLKRLRATLERLSREAGSVSPSSAP